MRPEAAMVSPEVDAPARPGRAAGKERRCRRPPHRPHASRLESRSALSSPRAVAARRSRRARGCGLPQAPHGRSQRHPRPARAAVPTLGRRDHALACDLPAARRPLGEWRDQPARPASRRDVSSSPSTMIPLIFDDGLLGWGRLVCTPMLRVAHDGPVRDDPDVTAVPAQCA